MAESNEKLVRRLAKRILESRNRVWDMEDDQYPELYVGGEKKINPKYLTDIQYAQIQELYFLLKDNEDLSEEDLEDILKVKFFMFKFLRKLNSRIPNLIEELRHNGVDRVAEMYASIKYEKDLNSYWRFH